MNDSHFSNTFRFLWKDFLGDFVAFPLWWYSKGTLKMIQFIMGKAQSYARTLSLSIWLKNLFVPMYGQYDIAGRIISFVLRLFELFFRSIFFIIWFFVLLALLGIWLFGPIGVFWYILYQLFDVTLQL